jgi:hypothetical protein
MAGSKAPILARTIKYLEMHGNIKDGVVTRYGLMWMATHIETAMVFLGCWTVLQEVRGCKFLADVVLG